MFDECFCVKTKLISSEHKAIEDPIDKNKKAVQMIIKIYWTHTNKVNYLQEKRLLPTYFTILI